MDQFISNLLGPLFTFALLLLVVRAFMGIRGKTIEGPECKNCGYSRIGLPNETPCPECGAEQKYPGSVLHIRKRKTVRKPKRIAIDLLMIVAVIGIAYGSIKLDDYRLNYYNGFAEAVQDGNLYKVESYLDMYPELADGRFRYHTKLNDSSGPLIYAANSGSKDTKKLITLLIEHQQDGAGPNGLVEVLNFAIETNDFKLAEMVFELGLRLEEYYGLRSENLLPYAAGRRGCEYEIIQLMLDHGSDPNLFIQKTALGEAVFRRDRIQVMTALLDAGADPNLPDHQGLTPIFMAVQHGRVDAVQLLIDAGADINALYADRMTPLDQAQMYIGRTSHPGQNHKAIVKLLIVSDAKTAEQVKQESPEP